MDEIKIALLTAVCTVLWSIVILAGFALLWDKTKTKLTKDKPENGKQGSSEAPR